MEACAEEAKAIALLFCAGGRLTREATSAATQASERES
jgi:hypothetical protein